jgi:hypothetical protein
LWFVSPQPQPGRAPVVLSFGAWAGGLTVNSFTSSSVFRVASVVSFARSVTASWIDAFAVAIPCSEFSRPTDEAGSGSDTVIAVSVRVETDAVVARDVVPSLVDAPATCARSTTTANTVAVNQIPRWFMRAAPLRAQDLGSGEFPLTQN